MAITDVLVTFCLLCKYLKSNFDFYFLVFSIFKQFGKHFILFLENMVYIGKLFHVLFLFISNNAVLEKEYMIL